MSQGKSRHQTSTADTSKMGIRKIDPLVPVGQMTHPWTDLAVRTVPTYQQAVTPPGWAGRRSDWGYSCRCGRGMRTHSPRQTVRSRASLDAATSVTQTQAVEKSLCLRMIFSEGLQLRINDTTVLLNAEKFWSDTSFFNYCHFDKKLLPCFLTYKKSFKNKMENETYIILKCEYMCEWKQSSQCLRQ